jgi:hypothetical protein
MDLSRRSLLRWAAGIGAIGMASTFSATDLFKPLPPEEKSLQLKLGKAPAAPELVKLKLSTYFDHAALPAPPVNFGHETMVPWWGMLGNGQDPDHNPPNVPDGAGCCAIAGPYHSLQLWLAETGNTLNIDTERVLQTYSDITGYDPSQTDPYTGENPTDNGSNMQKVVDYWQSTGFTDSGGKVHKIAASLALDPQDWDQLVQALYLFDGVGIGINVPSQWQTAFIGNQVWDAIPDPEYVGGHYVTGVGRRASNIVVVSWGRLQQMTRAGYEMANDEVFCYFSEERLLNGKDINGFDRAQLIADLQALEDEVKFPVDPPADEQGEPIYPWTVDPGLL